jgi:murein DD-endopeptidase MepM/ murein hydrolase activator NlpD
MDKIYKDFGFKEVKDEFGYRSDPINGEHAFHTGIDLFKGDKAAIAAFIPGVVLFAGFGKEGSGFGRYGNVVAIKDANSALHVYAHLDSVSVKVNDVVKQGQEIGKQGTTGRSTGSHLHYEVRKTWHPHFGWSTDEQNYCYEPTGYLQRHIGANTVVVDKNVPIKKETPTKKTYVVKSGDTLSEIANAHKLTLTAILKLNPQIKDKNEISVGQKINLG